MTFPSIFNNDGSIKPSNCITNKSKALIIHPGALGDCILTLHLCDFVKKHLNISQLDYMGNLDHIGFFPSRTCVDRVRSLSSIQLSRLFAPTDDFELEDNDKLIMDFAGYDWVISFLGEKGSNFEQNLIMTLFCTSSAEVSILSPKTTEGYPYHISQFHIDEFVNEKRYAIEAFCPQDEWEFNFQSQNITPSSDDKEKGKTILASNGIEISEKQKLFAITPGSGSKDKCWNIENFIELAKKLIAANYRPFFVVGPVELERFTDNELQLLQNTAPLIKNTSIVDLVRIFSTVDALIGNDSGPTHLAAAMGIPTIAVFGTTNPLYYRPMGQKSCFHELSADLLKAIAPESVDAVFDKVIGSTAS